MLSEALDAVFPSWLVRLDVAPTSRDPLGFAAPAARHADTLLPGLSVFTSRARYYSFLAWAIRESETGPKRGQLDRLHRLERLLVLNEALLHADAPDVCTYVGRRRGQRFVRERAREDLWELPSRVLKNQVTNGALRLYRNSLLSLGVVEEVDDDPSSVGLSLTARGDALATRYGRNVESTIARWALTEPEQRKRRSTLLDQAPSMCLSGKIDAYERKQLVSALVGKEGDALVRRETVRVLFQHGLLTAQSPLVDVAAEDADAIADDGGKPAEEAALAETRGNWGTIRRVLSLGPRPELHDMFEASAFEVLALALNRFFIACVDAVVATGRLGVGAWGEQVGAIAGAGYAQGTAKEWAGAGSLAQSTEELLQAGHTWPEQAALSLRLFIRTIFDENVRAALLDNRDEMIGRALDLAGDASSKSAAHLARQLMADTIDRHIKVSVTKGKSEWLKLDQGDLMRCEPQPTLPLFHALRFVQLSQLARDVKLTAEDVADEA